LARLFSFLERGFIIMIESNRIILRKWEDKDINDLVEGLNNINVSRWMAGVPFPYTENDAKQFIGRAKGQDEKNKISLAIVLKENNKVIGGTEITNINKKDGTAGGGIWLNEKYQKNGYGTEAFYLKIKYAFNELGLRRMENGYFPNNEKSKKMQEKLGYKDEGIRRKKFLCLATNEYVDECITGLLKEEFIDIYR
jgi:RimJ/RimL family protein N-acetyltransferase